MWRRIVAWLDELTIQRLGLIVAAGLLIATWYQSCLTRDALKETQKEFTAGERPWIGIVGEKREVVSLPNGIIVRVSQPYINYGKTPALDVVSVLRLRIGDPIPVQWSGTIHVIGPVLKECAKDSPRLHMIEGPVALPNAVHATMISPEDDVTSRWPDIEQNAVGLYLTGCIDYDDVFGQWHRTHVCLYWSRQTNGIVVACTEGNGAS